MTEDIVACKDCGFFFEDQGRVVGCVARAVEGSECGAFCLEDLVMVEG